ncbi:MAG: PAS domain S-box protein [Chloroflexota bacterium]
MGKTQEGREEELTALRQRVAELEAERKQAEEALGKHGTHYKDLTESLNEVIYRANPETFVATYVSNAIERIYGYAPQEWLKDPSLWERSIHPDDRERALLEFAEYRRALASAVIQYRIIRRDKLVRWVEDRVTWEKGQQGNVVSLNGIMYDVTERQQAEEKLRKYASILEMVREGIWQIDAKDRVTFVSPRMAEMLGHEPDEMVGKPAVAFMDEETGKLRPAVIKKRRRGWKGRYPTRLLHKDGTVVHTLNSATPLFDAKGRYEGLVTVHTDITQLKEAENRLIIANRALHMLSDSNQALIHATEELALLREICRIAVEVGGYRLAWIGLVEDDERKSVRPAAQWGLRDEYLKMTKLTGRGTVSRAIQTAVPCVNRDISINPDLDPWRAETLKLGCTAALGLPLVAGGLTLGALAIYSSAPDAFDTEEIELLEELAGDLAYGITALRKHAQHERALQALQRSEEKLRVVFESIAEGITVTDLDGRIIEANDSALGLHGYGDRKELIGRSSLDLIAEKDHSRAAENMKRTFEEGRSGTVEYALVTRDGREFDAELSAALLREMSGNPMGFVAITRDITERKKSETELVETLAKLRLAVLGTVHAVASVIEIRDPYTAGHQQRVTQLACNIARELGLGDEQIETVHMAGLIHDIGKVSVPSEILSKPARLSEIEYNLIKAHPEVGYQLLKDIDFPWPIADIIRQHHERLDGSGYPLGLSGEDIALEARILAVADVVEAMVSHRPYRPALGLHASMDELLENCGTLYDSRAVDACLKLLLDKGFTFDTEGST